MNINRLPSLDMLITEISIRTGCEVREGRLYIYLKLIDLFSICKYFVNLEYCTFFSEIDTFQSATL